ncbi:MAG TPA: FAD-dependent oxidoreductase [Gemmatimonadales bacterium]|nr:FAD-dependent oxidoreductase [Gemmatimonadales bacterium]
MLGRLVLVGGGHAHLFVLEAVAAGRFPGTDVTLVSASRHQTYSGLVPAFVAGLVEESALTIDLARLAERARARFVEGRVTEVETQARRVRLEDGRVEDYRTLSFATGALPGGLEVPGVLDHARSIRPLARVRELVASLDVAPAGTAVAVVGGGAGGVEIAFAICKRLGARGHVAVVDAGPRLMLDRGEETARVAMEELRRRHIGVALGARVLEVVPEGLRLDSGAMVRAQLVVWAAGGTPPSLFRDSGLATDEAGWLLVDETLRSVSHPDIFAAGDAAAVQGAPWVPKAGVHAVRQGPVLTGNLIAATSGRPIQRRFRAQRDFVALLGTADGSAIFSRGKVAFASPLAWRLKEWIDGKFMRRFQKVGG